MHRFSVAVGYFLIATLAITASPNQSRAETIWTAIGGEAHWGVSSEFFADLGITVEFNGANPNADGVILSISPKSEIAITTDAAQLQSIENGVVPFSDKLTIFTEKGKKIEVTDIRLVFPANPNTGELIRMIGEIEKVELELFTAEDSKMGFEADSDKFLAETGQFQMSESLRGLLQLPRNVKSASILLSVSLEWAGGDEPYTPGSENLPGGAPRGGNGGTICDQPGGPDVIVGELTGGGSGSANPTSEQIDGIWYDAFVTGTTSCNLGDVVLTWQSSSGTVHPAIGQNVFRLYNGRFEQIGQSWLKHGFAVAAGNACGCGCTSGGGLQPGCSDPYGPGLNGNPSTVKPKFRVNPTTGVHFHGSSPGFSGTVQRLCQIKHTDLNPALNSGARYFIEGQYIHEEDAGFDHDDNNASHHEITVVSTGTNEYQYNMLGQTIREQPAIRSWQAIDPTVVLSDAKVANDGLYIVGSKGSDNGDGTWHYEYAVHNLNGNRGAKSFSIPVGAAATLTNIEFRDVDYRYGDGEGSVSRDGTDWTPTVTDGVLTWNMTDVGDNSNALLWGTMYNFRFDADVAPESELGNATIECFRPLAGEPDSFTAAVIVPIPEAILIEIADGGIPAVISNCDQTTFDVRIAGNAETLDPATVKLRYSYDGGAFQDQPLTPLGGDMYEVALPTPQCGDSPRFFISATSTIGTTVTNPQDAESTMNFLTAFVGYEADDVLIETTNFEGGLPAGWSQNGLWNVGSSCSDIPNGACGDSDGSNAAYYGQPSTCNYDTGIAQQGSMFTPEFDVPLGVNVTLTYCSSFERHTFPGGDRPIVRVVPQGGPAEIVDEPSAGIIISSPPVWVERTVDLTAYMGQTISIEWNFDNLFAVDDDFMGWLVDNVNVTAVVPECIPGCAAPDGDLNIDTSANGLDVQLFATAIIDQSVNPVDLEHADFNGNGMIDMGDVDGMVGKLLE